MLGPVHICRVRFTSTSEHLLLRRLRDAHLDTRLAGAIQQGDAIRAGYRSDRTPLDLAFAGHGSIFPARPAVKMRDIERGRRLEAPPASSRRRRALRVQRLRFRRTGCLSRRCRDRDHASMSSNLTGGPHYQSRSRTSSVTAFDCGACISIPLLRGRFPVTVPSAALTPQFTSIHYQCFQRNGSTVSPRIVMA